MDELLAEFIAETQETLEALAGVVVSWESDPNDRDRLDAVFRFFHTVKGSCGFLDLPRFERLSHAAEDVLSTIRDGNASLDGRTISAVLSVMDRIAELCTALSFGEPLPHEDDDELIETLRACEQVIDSPAAEAGNDQQPAVGLADPDVDPIAAARPRMGSSPRTIRLPLSLIDQLMNGVSDMVLARNELSRKLRELDTDPGLEMAFERLSICVAEMRDTISKTRMQRVERLFMAIPRMVRDLGRELDKQIELVLEGGEVEMDREMVEVVADPLTHIVRNSIDHGIETPEERRAAGKPPGGRLMLSARQSGSQIVIEIEDDGRGINVDAVVRKTLSLGLVTEQQLAQMSAQEKLELIFTPGLSTAESVTAVSGRGVGMDVVRANIERLGGVIALANRPGAGLTITLRVPLTLTIIPGLILSAGGQQFAIPRSAVIEIMHENNAMLRLSSLGGADVAIIRGTRYSMIELETLIGLPRVAQPGPRTLLLVRSANGSPYALSVASVENHEELVIRPAAPMIMASGLFAGMTLPDNGQPMLLLDAGGLAQLGEIANDFEIARLNGSVSEEVRQVTRETASALHFVELDGRERIMRLSLIDRVEDIAISHFHSSAGRSFVRIEERLLPSFHFVDETIVAGQNDVTCLRLRDGCRELCYPVRAIIDIIDAPEDLDMALAYDQIAGVALIGDQQVEVIDGFALFATLDADQSAKGRPIRIVIDDANDNWNREILAPLLRHAGYDVLLGSEPVTDDSRSVYISTQGEIPPAAGENMPVIRLRASAVSEPRDDPSSIYRYDRARLMQALAEASQERMSA